MQNEQKLFAELEAADKAGDTAHAEMVADFIAKQRTAFSQANNWTNDDIVNKYGIDGTLAKLKETAPEKIADTMGRFEKIVVGFGRGGEDVWQGTKQLAMKGANAKLPEQLQYDDESLDQQIRQENQQFNKDFEGDYYAKGGRIGGQIAGTAPAGMGVGALLKPAVGTSRAMNALNYAKQGAGVGMTEASLMPTMGDNFLQEKATQAGLGATFGGVLGGGVGALKGLKELGQDGVGATVQNAMDKGGQSGIGKIIKGSADDIAERKELYARNPSVLASKAQKSGSKYDKVIEEFGKSNVFLADKADDMANKEMASLSKWVSNQADNISKTKNTTEQTFRNIQKLPEVIVKKLRTKRTAQATKDYGLIDNYAKGQKVVKLDNLNSAIDEIIGKYKGVKGSDATKIYNQALALKKSYAPKVKPAPAYSANSAMGGNVTKETVEQHALSARESLSQLQAWSGKGSGKVFKDVEDYGVDDFLKNQLKDALLKDMDSVSGQLGDNLRKANVNWRAATQNMEQVKGSVFGKIAGKELKGDIDGLLDNTISPEEVLQKVRTEKPTRVSALMEYMNTHDPKLKKEFQAQYLNNAIDESMVGANTAGMEQRFNPTTFLNSLGVTRGKNGWEGVKRLNAIFGNDKKAKLLINDMLAMTRNQSDAFGKNFSGTASHNFLNDMFSSMSGFFTGSSDLIKKGTSTIAHYLGSRNILDNAYKTAKPFNKTIGQGTNMAGRSALGVAPMVNEVNNQ